MKVSYYHEPSNGLRNSKRPREHVLLYYSRSATYQLQAIKEERERKRERHTKNKKNIQWVYGITAIMVFFTECKWESKFRVLTLQNVGERRRHPSRQLDEPAVSSKTPLNRQTAASARKVQLVTVYLKYYYNRWSIDHHSCRLYVISYSYYWWCCFFCFVLFCNLYFEIVRQYGFFSP